MLGPQVSVLLPVRDAEASVERALRSMLSQTLPPVEVVAVDDGSRDGTPGVLARLAAADERVRVLTTQPAGLVAALQRGLAECQCAYVARMDADDEALPQRLEASVAALEADARLAAVGTQVELVRADRPVSPNMTAYGRWLNSLTTPAALFADRFVESPLCHPAATIRRAALDEVGGWRDDGFAEDYQLWLELLGRGHRLSNVPRVLFRWTDREERLTRTDPRYGLERMIRLKARYLARGLAQQRCRVWGAGETGLKLARALRDEGVEVTALFDVDPRKVGARIDGAPVRSYRSLSAPGEHLIAAVGAKGARQEIRAHLAALGWCEGEHFTCAA